MQTHMHAIFLSTGGVVPAVAAQLHRDGLQKALDEALRRSGQSLEDMSVVAVTTGPGLALCLKEGLVFAKELVRQTWYVCVCVCVCVRACVRVYIM